MILSMVLTPKITELTYSFSFGPTFPRRIMERKSCMLPRGFFISWAILAAISPMALSLSSLSKRSFIFCIFGHVFEDDDLLARGAVGKAALPPPEIALAVLDFPHLSVGVVEPFRKFRPSESSRPPCW